MDDLPPRTAALPPSPFLRLTALLGTTPPGEEPIALSVGEPQGPVPAFVAFGLPFSAKRVQYSRIC